jgi:hypothetical protein
MKRLIASLLVVIFGATMVMAESSDSKKMNSSIITELTQNQFVDICGLELSDQEMVMIKGGKLPDCDGSVFYGSGSRKEVMNSDYIPTKSQVKSSINDIKKSIPISVSVSVKPELSSPKATFGYDITKPRGPYVSGSVGPVSIKIKYKQ